LPRINSSFTAQVRNPGRDTLLEYLVRRFTYHSREEWLDLLGKGRLELEGKTAQGGETLREGNGLRFAVVDYDEPEVPLDYRIVERHGDLCFVHKPAGMPVHRTGKIFFQTLANLVRERLGDMAWAPLNRLDRETGGLVAFARGPEAFKANAPSSPDTQWIKFYAAVTRGIPPSPAGLLDHPLGETGDGPIRCRMNVLAGGKTAQTLYRILASAENESLIILMPITGRKHQLRAHLAELGCPIIGDKIYSLDGAAYLKQLDGELDEEDYRALGARHHLLHAFHLRLEKTGGASLSAWDWDFGPEFSRRLERFQGVDGFKNAGTEMIRKWCEGEGFRAISAEAKALRESRVGG
jgi:23S rRNA-/tRNA-specific pseudouridylate synthase